MPVFAAIGAHALDAELMGGAIALDMNSKGWKTYLIHMTRGERGASDKDPDIFGAQIEGEMRKCAEKLNSESIWLGYKAGCIPKEKSVIDLCNTIRRLNIDIIITHWKGSYHPRHVETHDIVINSIKMANDPSVITQYDTHSVTGVYFGENMEDLDGFAPNVYYDISNYYGNWMNSLECYELFRNKVNKYPYKEFYSSNSISRGIESGVQYAKALMIPKVLINQFDFKMHICNPEY